ncbi:putative endonuclease lcl3 [Coemansia sp. RSA 1722]|nr:putative endonuclease lcl3 [Coemansia sp. RSA 1722]
MPTNFDFSSLSYSQKVAIYGQTALYLGLGAGISFGIYMMFKRYQTCGDIPDSVIKSHKKFYGIVMDVSDGDTIRVYHTPLIQWFNPPPQKKRGISNFTISVRLSAVDAPEVSHFGKPAQPLSKEAKDYLASQILGKRVSIKPLSKDQYSRLVATVSYRQMLVFKKNAAHEMLKQGLGQLYRGGGAQYDGEKDLLESLEANAKRAKRGVWGLKKGDYESPAEYKRKHKG